MFFLLLIVFNNTRKLEENENKFEISIKSWHKHGQFYFIFELVVFKNAAFSCSYIKTNSNSWKKRFFND